MRFEYDEKNKPILITESNGIKIKISFSDNPKNIDLRQTIVDLLSSAYENRVLT
jgi:hypothetical protein